MSVLTEVETILWFYREGIEQGKDVNERLVAQIILDIVKIGEVDHARQ